MLFLYVYENLASAYGRENPFVKNYLAEVVTPQKADYDMLIAKPVSTAATAADRLLSSPTLAKAYTPPKLSPTFRVSNTMAAFKGIVGGLETSVKQLTTARDAAAASGLTGYVSQLDEALAAEQGKLSKALEDRQAAVDNSLPDPVKRAMGSPPEGEVADTRSRALLKKLSGGSEANTVPLQKFSKGGAVKKAAELLKSLGVAESKVAGKELTTMQDFHTSLGDSVRERAAKMQQQMDAMQFKYGPGQYVFTESGAKKNLPPLQIKAKHLYGDQPMREPHPENPLLGKVIKDPETGRAKRTPYEPGYLVRQQRSDGWAEFVIPESVIKGTVDGFAKGGPVYRAQGSPIYGEIPDSGPITADTRAAFKAKGPSASSVVGESARMLRNIMGEGVSNLESAVRGSVAAIPGSVGDIESIFRESDKTRRFATTEEVLRDYMPKRATKPTKEAKGFEEVGSYLPLPVPAGTVSKAATMTGKGVEKGAAKMLERLGPRTGRSWEPLLAQAGAAPMYAVKPKGGTFFPAGSDSSLDSYIDKVVSGLSRAEGLAGRDAKTVADFIREKGRKYLTSTYGTADDPLRQALLEGRLPLYGSDKERFRGYALEAMRAGNPEAVEDLEGAYDTATGLLTYGYKPPSVDNTYTVSNRMQEKMRAKLLEEGVPEELINTVFPTVSSAENMSGYYPAARRKLGELLVGMENIAPSAYDTDLRQAFIQGVGDTDKGSQSLLYAATKEQPIYDINSPSADFMRANNVADALASIPVAELERMTFPEALIKGAQNTRLKRDRGLMLEKARDGKTVPKEIYFDGTQPVYEIDKNQKWVRIMSPDAVELEGAAMRHSIGGYKTSNSYNLGGRPAFESGLARVFSLRNEKGVPQVTVETKFTDEDGLMINEVRSKFNSEPTAEEKRAVLQLFETLGPKDIRSTKYRNTRSGEALKEEDQVTVNWGDEFKNYMQYKNKGEE